ncbi:MAG: dTDP-4-dehydrorhamnose reductase [Saprospiraceae bacterium]|jgi:dTDP-4-dehydrorhamnose reductase
MKIFITGSNGLLGQKLIANIQKLTPDVKIIAASKGVNRLTSLVGFKYYDLDISNESEVLQVVEKECPDVIINSAAMTNVDQCEDHKDSCWDVNVHAVKYLVEACEKINSHFIQLSTDFIFDGENGPYKENDLANPLSYYGESKLASEQIVMDAKCSWAIVRTVLVYGVGENLGRTNIVLWAIEALGKNQGMNVVDDQFRTPTLAEDLAIGCLSIARHKKEGVYNVSGKDYMSILELVQRVGAFFSFKTNHINVISSSTLNQAAKRPPVTGFVLHKAKSELGYTPMSFEEGLEVVQSQIDLS